MRVPTRDFPQTFFYEFRLSEPVSGEKQHRLQCTAYIPGCGDMNLEDKEGRPSKMIHLKQHDRLPKKSVLTQQLSAT